MPAWWRWRLAAEPRRRAQAGQALRVSAFSFLPSSGWPPPRSRRPAVGQSDRLLYTYGAVAATSRRPRPGDTRKSLRRQAWPHAEPRCAPSGPGRWRRGRDRARRSARCTCLGAVAPQRERTGISTAGDRLRAPPSMPQEATQARLGLEPHRLPAMRRPTRAQPVARRAAAHRACVAPHRGRLQMSARRPAIIRSASRGIGPQDRRGNRSLDHGPLTIGISWHRCAQAFQARSIIASRRRRLTISASGSAAHTRAHWRACVAAPRLLDRRARWRSLLRPATKSPRSPRVRCGAGD